MVIWKIIGIFFICIVGFAANKLGWLPNEAGKYLSRIVINISTPCVIIFSIADQELNTSNLSAMLEITVITIVGTAVSFFLGLLFCRVLKIGWPEKGIYVNFALFSNNGFLGLPISYTLLGTNGLYIMSIANCVTTVIMFSLGIEMTRGKQGAIEGQGKKSVLKQLSVFFNPPLVASIIGILLFLIQAPVPSVIMDVLNSLGATMTPLAMMIIGIQLSGSSPKALIANRKLIAASLNRLIIIPVIVLAMMLPSYFGLIPIGIGTNVIIISLINFMTPIAVSLVPLCEEYGNDTKLAAEGVILSTAFSMATLPVWCVLLSAL